MTRPRVVVSSQVFPETLARLSDTCELDANPGPEPWPADELQRRCAAAVALLAFMTDRVDAAFLAGCQRLRIVACALKGADNFDAAACADAGVWLTLAPDLLTEPTAELALGLMLALGRNIVPGDRLVRSGAFRGWRPTLYGAGLQGATVGIAGAGRVGQAIARRLPGFLPGRVLLHDRDAAAMEAVTGAEPVAWAPLLAASERLFLALPLTNETRHVLNGAALAALPAGALVVNVGRGSVVDEAAIASALDDGRLGGYAADVFAMEDWALPDRPSTISTSLRAHPRTVFTPHLGSAVVESRRAIELAAADSILQALAGAVPQGAVNRPVNRPASRPVR